MALGFRLDLRQSQQLVMTPQLQQAIKLLQMSNLELREYVERELESNPLVRIEDGSETVATRESPAQPDADDTPLDARVTPEGDHSLAAETFDNGIENLYDTGPSDAGSNEIGPGEGGFVSGIGAGVVAGGSHSFDLPDFDTDRQPDHPENLRAYLLAQLGMRRSEPQVLLVARLMIEELDEHGYLRADLAELAARLGAAPEVIEAGLALVQGCEPTGVGARNLAECLALQLAERNRLDPAMRLLIDNLPLLERGDRRRLRTLCGVDDEDFADMLAEIRSLDPRPCASFESVRAETLIPDVYLRRLSWGGWEVELNTETLPRVLVDNRYAAQVAGNRRETGRDAARETRSFISECRASATWLVRSLDQRARTILTVAREIVRQQDGFFTDGIAGLKPLTLKMVADATGMHESTASRVTSNKYIATERGIFELKFFFTNSVGSDGLAATAVRHRIRNMVAAEESGEILSDDTIVERLQRDGIDIARRTVAKYRSALGIPSSVERRRQRAMMSNE